MEYKNLKVVTTFCVEGMVLDELINLLDYFSNEYPEALIGVEDEELAVYVEEEEEE